MNVRTVAGGRGKVQSPQAKQAILKKPKRHFNLRRFVAVAAAVAFAVYFVCTVISQQIKLTQKNREIEALEEQITAASQETEQLQEELENLDDPEYLERVAREKLGLVRPNERIFIDANKSESNQGD